MKRLAFLVLMVFFFFASRNINSAEVIDPFRADIVRVAKTLPVVECVLMSGINSYHKDVMLPDVNLADGGYFCIATSANKLAMFHELDKTKLYKHVDEKILPAKQSQTRLELVTLCDSKGDKCHQAVGYRPISRGEDLAKDGAVNSYDLWEKGRSLSLSTLLEYVPKLDNYVVKARDFCMAKGYPEVMRFHWVGLVRSDGTLLYGSAIPKNKLATCITDQLKPMRFPKLPSAQYDYWGGAPVVLNWELSVE